MESYLYISLTSIKSNLGGKKLLLPPIHKYIVLEFIVLWVHINESKCDYIRHIYEKRRHFLVKNKWCVDIKMFMVSA